MSHSPDTLRVLESHVLRGPNAYAYRPMIRFALDLGRLEQHPTSRLPGFTDRLLERLPGLLQHGCSSGTAGGFLHRLHEGTWLGHVIEHVAIELQNLLGDEVAHGKTRGVSGRPGVYHVVYSYREERVGLLAGRLAVRLVDDLLPRHLQGAHGVDLLVPEGTPPPSEAGSPFDFEAEQRALEDLSERLALGPSTGALVAAAEERGIPVRRLDHDSFVQLGHGVHGRRIRASVTGTTSALALETSQDKLLTQRLLADAGLPLPASEEVESVDAAQAAAVRLGPPVVIKPADANHGRGVTLDLRDPEAVRWGFDQAVRHCRRVVVERLLPGHDHRLLVVDGRLVAAARRVPAHVVGDGVHTVAELVELTNRDPRRGEGHDRELTRITMDDQVEWTLARTGRSGSSVPAEGESVFLRTTANLSTGGWAVDVTEQVHPDVAECAVRAARTVGLNIAGVDVVAPDLRRPLGDSGGGIVEVNAGPGLRMHLAPSEGEARDVAGPILDLLFPGGSSGRIPLVAITGTNGKTTTARMVARVLERQGKRVGLATSSGITIAGREVATGDTTGPWSARLVLSDPTVEAAVLETARGGILREGLAFDRCTVGAVLNVQSDHLGIGGIDTLDDMAWIKSLVAEVVAPEGTAVLNADDPRTEAMRERAGGTVTLFSMHGASDGPGRLEGHVREGGVAVVRQPGGRGELLAIYDGGVQRPVVWAHEIPATFAGRATPNVQNALATIAVCHGLGVPVGEIAAGLRSFGSSFEENPGRLNVYEEHPFTVVLDYGHNADGLTSMTDLIRHLKGSGRATGVVTMCGDRRDEDIVHTGRISARLFDSVIVREDADLRGRASGEVARLLLRGLSEEGLPDAAVDVVLPEMEALEEAMRRAAPGDLVMHFAEDVEEAWRRIVEFRPGTVAPDPRVARDLPKSL